MSVVSDLARLILGMDVTGKGNDGNQDSAADNNQSTAGAGSSSVPPE